MSEPMDEAWCPKLAPKQLEILNIQNGYTGPIPLAVLASGPRLTGKTTGIEHLICKHLYETKGAHFAVVTQTTKNATVGGVWEDLVGSTGVVNEWIDAGIFEYTTVNSGGQTGWKTDSITKSNYFTIRNIHGGHSRLTLMSLDQDKEVGPKFKSTRFSGIWFSELSNFKIREVFNISYLQLRMIHLHPWEHLWIGDTNPDEDGEDSWIYKLWWGERLDKNHSMPEFRDMLRLIEVFPEDNPYVTKAQLKMVAALYADDPQGYARNVLGQWVKGTKKRKKHFADLYIPEVHVVGQTDEDAIKISPNTTDMIGTWDLGNSINSSAHLLEKRIISNLDYWYVHDEVVAVDDQISTEQFTQFVLAKIDSIEQFYEKKFGWRHWSDDSSLTVFRAASGSFDYQIVMAASGGRIVLQAVNKPHESVAARVRLLRQLLRERRIFIAKRCHHTQQMLLECAKGTQESKFVAENEFKHAFDSLTYGIYMESLERLLFGDSTVETVKRESRLVSI